MEILKKILKNLLILFGIVLAAIMIMLFCMYFFKTKFFQYGFKFKSPDSQVLILNNPQNIEINSFAVEVEIKAGSENKILYTDNFAGIVKGIKHDDGTIEIPKSYIEVTDLNGKTTITVIEPENGIFSRGNSKLEVYINEDYLKYNIPAIKITSAKSNVNINLGSYKCDVEFNSISLASLSAKSSINYISGSFSTGKIICEANVGYANVATKNGTFQIKGDVIGAGSNAGDVTVKGENAYIKLNNIKGTLTYIGENGVAKGGKIIAESIVSGITIESKNIDLKIDNLGGGANINVSESGKVNINKYVSTGSNKVFNTGKGAVSINYLDVDKIEINTTNGTVSINATSIVNANNNSIKVKTTFGDVKINASITNNNVKQIFKGTIDATTEKGSIVLKEVNCIVNARVANKDRGKIVVYFETIYNLSSLETYSGDLIVDVKAGSAAFLNVIASKKSITLSNTTSFAEKTALTPIYNAQSINESPVLTIISKKGKVQVKEYV